jgi:hypothetical protein
MPELQHEPKPVTSSSLAEATSDKSLLFLRSKFLPICTPKAASHLYRLEVLRDHVRLDPQRMSVFSSHKSQTAPVALQYRLHALFHNQPNRHVYTSEDSTTRNMSYLLDLPAEIQVSIANACSTVDVKRLSETCHLLGDRLASCQNLKTYPARGSPIYHSCPNYIVPLTSAPTTLTKPVSLGAVAHVRR